MKRRIYLVSTAEHRSKTETARAKRQAVSSSFDEVEMKGAMEVEDAMAMGAKRQDILTKEIQEQSLERSRFCYKRKTVGSLARGGESLVDARLQANWVPTSRWLRLGKMSEVT
jgi:hypothetical protein